MSDPTDRMHAGQRRIRLRFLVLVPLIIACILITRAHIIAVGGSYELAFQDFAGKELTADKIQIDPPGIVEVGDIWQDDEGIPHVVFRAGTPEKGMVLIGFEDGGTMFEMQTTKSGVVVSEGFDVMGWEYICISLILVSGCIGVLCSSAIISLWRRSWYGYEMAAYIGGAVFFLLHAIQFAVFFLSGWFATFSDFAAADAIGAKPGGRYKLQDIRVCIGLDGIMDPPRRILHFLLYRIKSLLKQVYVVEVERSHYPGKPFQGEYALQHLSKRLLLRARRVLALSSSLTSREML